MSEAKVTDIQENTWKPEVNPWLIAIAVMLSTFMVVLDSSIANVALPHMAGSFSATSHESMWILTSYLIANGIILPTTAWFSNLFGRKNFLIICIIIFTSASALCGVANSLDMMILARILQGLGGGALMPISQSVLIESFPKEQRGISMAVFGLGIVLAPVIGPTLGGWITDNFTWNWIFYINIPVGIVAIILSQMFIEDPPYIKIKRGILQKIDYIGFSALIIWLVSLQLVLDNGQNLDWFSSTWVCIGTAISVIAMIFFTAWEIWFKASIVDLKVFSDRNFAVGTFLSTLISAILYSTLAILPFFLQSLLGYTAYDCGMAITPRGVGCLVSIALSGYLANKVDDRIVIIVGFLLLTIASFMFGNLNLQISMNDIVFPNVICGLALGFIFIPLATMSFSTLKNEHMTNATGLQSLVKNIGGAIGTSVVFTLISRGQQAHQANLVGHLNSLNPVFTQKVAMIQHFLSLHMNPVIATHKANFFMYGSLMKQSLLCSFIDGFRLYGLLGLSLVPVVFLFKGVKLHKKDNSENAGALH